MKARRASVQLLYDTVNISRDIAPFLKSLTFSDKIHPRVGGVLFSSKSYPRRTF